MIYKISHFIIFSVLISWISSIFVFGSILQLICCDLYESGHPFKFYIFLGIFDFFKDTIERDKYYKYDHNFSKSLFFLFLSNLLYRNIFVSFYISIFFLSPVLIFIFFFSFLSFSSPISFFKKHQIDHHKRIFFFHIFFF